MSKALWTIAAVVWYAACGMFFALFLQSLWFFTLGSGTVRVGGDTEGFSEGIDMMWAASKTVGFWILPAICGVLGGAFMGHLEYTTGGAFDMFREPSRK